MKTVEELKKEIVKVQELEDKLFEKRQLLYNELSEAEQKEKEAKYIGKPQLFEVNLGYNGKYYIAATTKKEALEIFKKHHSSIKIDKDDIDTLGLQIIYFECTETR